MKTKLYTGTGTNFYRASQSIADVVNLAIELGRPLLVEGEPGCGKTMLAYSIAAELEMGEVVKISVKSTSQAKDLLYFYDSLQRLQDVQETKVEPHYHYFSLGLLGDVINGKDRRVVLIDEIDKADIDFPNDLLDVLDTFSFDVPDVAQLTPAQEKARGFGSNIQAQQGAKPIVIITSNREKQLPEPFLRRCLYIHLEFPREEDVLENIVRMNIAADTITWEPRQLNDEILTAAIGSFLNVRRLSDKSDVGKLPTTSELIDWVRILHSMNKDDKTIIAEGVYPPYWELLFKAKQDLEAYSKMADAELERTKG